ncbi:MAG: LacI family DNA-binding transcriptional regulator [Elusimicrobiota bacterium]
MLTKQKDNILPTMDTIAKRLGVSKMTVSRVLNNHPYVSEKVRKKVLGLMKDLNYKPNLSAAVLSRRSSKTLGLIIQFYNNNILSTHYLMEVMAGVEQAVDSSGYNLVLFSRITPKTRNYEDITNWYFSGLVKGFMLVAPSINSPLVKTLIRENITFVNISSKSDNKNVNWICSDSFKGGYLATEHLIKLGHKNIGFIGGPADRADAIERENGYLRALGHYDIKCQKQYMISGDFEQKLAYRAAMKLLALGTPPTGIFAANDLMALGAMQAVREKGLSVPKDISIVGFDNIDLALTAEPTLTTINQDAELLGKLAAEYLINHVKDKFNPVLQKTLDVSLIKRESTAPPRK